MIRRLIGTAAGASSIAVAGMLGFAAPAAAHSYSIELNSNIGAVENNHTRFIACDRRANGIGVRVDWYVNSSRYGSIGDGNGSASGCGVADLGYSATGGIWRLCEGSNCTLYQDV